MQQDAEPLAMGSPHACVQRAELWAVPCPSWCREFVILLTRFPALLSPGYG